MRHKLSWGFIIILCSALIILKVKVLADVYVNENLSTPEKTLNTYINALKKGDLDEVLKCYYSEQRNFKFNLTGPIKIIKYEIVSKKIYTKLMAENYKAIPKAKIGDIEFDVKEYIDGREEMFTYLLRQINQEWRIISHNSWSQPD